MKAKEIFDLAVKIGIANDPRGADGVAELLHENKKAYDDLTEKKKLEFDKEKFVNPYSDSRFLAGDENKEVKRILVGIDVGTEEILLAKELERTGKPVDLVFAHHPEGKALATLHEVMDLQTAVYARAGVPENIAEGILREQLQNVSRRVAPVNHYKAVMAAELLDIPFMNVHTPADNCVWRFVDTFIDKKKPRKIGEVVEALKEIPEYKKAAELKSGPVIFAGDEDSRTGKIAITGMTGGTNGKGSEKLYERMSHFGIGTEIAMHVSEEDRDEALKHHLNIVIAGHIASDSLGLNIILDELEKEGIEIIPCSGFIRHSRVRK